MNGPTRFKSERSLRLEGQLLAAGHAEQPEPASVQYAARRLGLPPSLLATYAACAVVSAASTATATTASAGKLAAFGGLTALSTTKAVVVGVGIGVGIAAGTTALRDHRDVSPRVLTARPPVVGSTERSPRVASNSPNTEPPIRTSVTTAPALRSGSGLSSKDATLETPVPAAAMPASAVARFDDAESAVQGRAIEPSPGAQAVVPTTRSAASSAPQLEQVVDPRLAREIASLDRARGLKARGQPAAALQELDAFGRHWGGYSTLGLEARLVQIDALVAMGQREAAARIARSLPWANLSTSQRQRLDGLVRYLPP
jgi:hypothetical protein